MFAAHQLLTREGPVRDAWVAFVREGRGLTRQQAENADVTGARPPGCGCQPGVGDDLASAHSVPLFIGLGMRRPSADGPPPPLPYLFTEVADAILALMSTGGARVRSSAAACVVVLSALAALLAPRATCLAHESALAQLAHQLL